MSVFVARVLSSSCLRSETQVPSPPPSLPSASSGPRLAPPANDTAETATAFRAVDGSTRCSCSSSTVPASLAGSRKNRRSAPTSTPVPAVTATHQRLPSNQPGLSGSVNQRLVPAFTSPRNASAASASTTPKIAALRMRLQNPGDRVKASASEAASSPARGRVCPLMTQPSEGCGPSLSSIRSRCASVKSRAIAGRTSTTATPKTISTPVRVALGAARVGDGEGLGQQVGVLGDAPAPDHGGDRGDRERAHAAGGAAAQQHEHAEPAAARRGSPAAALRR